MVGADPSIDRRRVLKTTGTALAGLSAYSGLGGASEAGDAQKSGEQVVPDEERFSDDLKKGYVLGTYKNPVTPETIRKIQKKVLKNREKSGAIVHDPTAKPAKEYQKSGDSGQVLGYAFKLENGRPSIFIKEEPKVISSKNNLPVKDKKNAVTSAHNDTLEFLNNNGGE
ncbi:hypothetical protein [Haloferax sp. DFSO60]|uniref:hypothetical protein n=1 Tax=Haloferax sp. DFSO60 TaxID=3388652 RepID=UPI003977EEC2